MKPSLLFYCQHSLGLGHLARSWTIAKALSRRFRVTLMCGGPLPAGLEPPSCCEVVALPPMTLLDNGQLTSLDARYSAAAALEVRRDMMLRELATAQPAVIIVELFPFGRKKFGRELLPVLEAARAASPTPIVVCSLRDILVARGDRQADHDERARELVDRYFDAVLVHADPSFARLDEFFRPAQPMRTPVHYTGFVAGTPPARAHARSGILVSGGGGRFAEPLFLMAIEAHRHIPNAPAMTVVAGPLCQSSTWERLAAAANGNPSIRLSRVVADLSADMATSRLSISQCGYNTALDIVRAGVPALVVPFAEEGETEQMDRARRLEALGILRVFPSGDLNAITLAAAAEDALAFSPAACTLDLGGADRTARLLDAFVGRGIAADVDDRVVHERLA
jgi:predicted glycosyltransferase